MFIRMLRAKVKKSTETLPSIEDEFSAGRTLTALIRTAQSDSFPPITALIQRKHSYLLSLSPFLDSNGIVRVGGRLVHSNLEYGNKFPILLPDRHPLTDLILKYHHADTRHQGRSITLSALRQAGYFIPKASSTVRKLVNSCVTCRKLRAPMGEQRMADLPADRLECAPPFSNVGIDVFGPYEVSDGCTTRRYSSLKKCWALIFTCLNSRATHIEPLPHLDISSMKNALRRFFCVRGQSKIFSVCAVSPK